MLERCVVGPAVSIGMPVFNGASFIEQALDAILAQTFEDFELLISDNASTDGTAAICEKYARSDHRIRYVRQLSNVGAFANFQYVLDNAVGTYFMWAACDDFWSREWLARLQQQLAGGGTRACFGQVLHVDAASQLIAHVVTGRVFNYRGSRWRRRLRFFTEFEGLGKANLFYALFDRQVLCSVRLEQYAHDYHVIFRVLSSTEIAGVVGVYLYKRVHENAASVLVIQQRSVFRKILLRAVLPVDLDFLQGYFRGVSTVEKVLLFAALPIKYLKAFPHMLSRLQLALQARRSGS